MALKAKFPLVFKNTNTNTDAIITPLTTTQEHIIYPQSTFKAPNENKIAIQESDNFEFNYSHELIINIE